MSVNIGGIIAVSVFYLIVLAMGIWASWKEKKRGKNTTDSVVLAGRNIGVTLGTLTLIATWAGISVCTASSERAFSKGVLWCQAPIGFGLSLVFGGLIFAKPMRKRGFTTLMDLFQEKYGNKISTLLMLPSLIGDTLWLGSIFAALGGTLSVILAIDNRIMIVASSVIILIYTFLGGMYSVAFTDVFQLFCIVAGMTLCVPFIWHHPSVDQGNIFSTDWLGTIEPIQYGSYIDNILLMAFGGIPSQVYFQRILSMKTARRAQAVSIISSFIYPLLAIPAILVGVVAKSADWTNGTEFGQNITDDMIKDVLPLALQYMTPTWVSLIGLGAISATIMSSADSVILAVSSLLAHNIFKVIFRPQASDRLITIVIRICMVAVSVFSTSIALTLTSIYNVGILTSDLIYITLFPQLVLVLFYPDHCNKYGCIASFVIAAVLRCLCGESILAIPVIMELPLFANDEQNFPFRTTIMFISLLSHLLISYLSWLCFAKGWLNLKFDFLNSFQTDKQTGRVVSVPLKTASPSDVNNVSANLLDPDCSSL